MTTTSREVKSECIDRISPILHQTNLGEDEKISPLLEFYTTQEFSGALIQTFLLKTRREYVHETSQDSLKK